MSDTNDSSIAIVEPTTVDNATSDQSSSNSNYQPDPMMTLVAAIDNFSPNTEGGNQLIKTLRSAIVEINNANARIAQPTMHR
jgi:hypothetical protein